MAKKQTFGADALQQKAAHRRMAKVIISTKSAKNKFAFKEAMVDQDNVQNFIKENKA
jgi:hypothetical protein